MHLEKRSIRNLPPDAVVISEADALKHYYKHIYSTRVLKDVWALKYGYGITGLVSIGTSFSLISYYRNRVKLGRKGSIILPIVCSLLPTSFSVLFHYSTIQSKIILQQACTSCAKIQAIGYQNLFAVGYPVLPGALLCFVMAIQHATYDVPGFMNKSELIGTANLYLKFTRRIYPRILIFVALNSLAAWFVTSQEFKNFETIYRKLKEQDEKLRALIEENNYEHK